MSHLSWEYKLSVFCGVCSVLLLMVLGAEWWYGRHYRQQVLDNIFNVNKANFEMQAIPTYPFSKQPMEHYADIVNRPVFFEGRKPIAKVVEPANTPTSTPKAVQGDFDLILTGIVKTPKGVKALFQNPKATVAGEKNKSLAEGQVFNGWKVIDIQNDKVRVQQDADIKDILLLKSKPKIATVKAASINPFAPQNMNRAPAANVPPPQGMPPRAPAPPSNVNPFIPKH